MLSAGLTNGVARCQKTGYPDPRQHFCTQRSGSAASLAQGHSIRGVEEGVTTTSFRSSGRWEPSALRQSTTGTIMERPMDAAEDAELETTSPLAPRARPAPGALQQQSTPAPWQSLVAASGGSTQGMAFTVAPSAKRKAADRAHRQSRCGTPTSCSS